MQVKGCNTDLKKKKTERKKSYGYGNLGAISIDLHRPVLEIFLK